MLADHGFREEVCAAQGGTPSEIDASTASGAGMTVRRRPGAARRGHPGFAKKFVGDEINIVQREEWSTEDRADLHVTIPGKPGAVTGSITLAESGGTTSETVDVEIKVNIPLVGGKIEAPDRRHAPQGAARRGRGRQRLPVALSDRRPPASPRPARPAAGVRRSPAASTTNGAKARTSVATFS